MKRILSLLLLAAALIQAETAQTKEPAVSIYDFKAQRINGQEIALSEYKGKVLLIVNTASKCGFTPQYEGLEALYEKYKDRGFMILGFPCNQFSEQEPGTNEEIANFCRVNYGVSFDMFAKIDVNGDDAHPLFKYLKSEATGIFGTESIKWNFTKFLIDREGKVIDRYAPSTKPASLEDAIEKLLQV
jgi:glutathione peroxidase